MSRKAPIEFRAAVTPRTVDHERRTIELIVVPWDEWATVEYQGRLIEESFAPGSFGAVDVRNARERILVNMDHDRAQWIGRVENVYPDDLEGLRAELKIRRTPEGTQALWDAADGMVGASAGFGVLPENTDWLENRSRRRIRAAFLDHVALTPTPAYVGAAVIDVRNAPGSSTSATPNLDAIMAERAAAAYDPRV